MADRPICIPTQSIPPVSARRSQRSLASRRPLAGFLLVGCLLTLHADNASGQSVSANPSLTTPTGVTTLSAEIDPAGSDTAESSASPLETSLNPAGTLENMLSPSGLSSTLQIMLALTVISLAPSILIMTTCFIRFIIVLGLLRQALGTQQLPPNQVIISLCLFLTFMVMAPVWGRSYREGIQPYTSPPAGEAAIPPTEALERTIRPVRQFMVDQIERTGNSDAVWMFLDYQQASANSQAEFEVPDTYDDVPLSVLLPSFMLSEVKTAFLIGFQLYLPFVIIDIVISSVLISMGMMMLPPVLISLLFNLLLFVFIDGCFLTVGMLLESMQPFQ